MEAVIPFQVGLPTIQTKNFDEIVNNETIALDLDLAEEECENAWIKLASYQQEVARGYNRSVRLWSFKPNDLIWKKVIEKSKKKKLMPNWEGPFHVLKHLGLEKLQS